MPRDRQPWLVSLAITFGLLCTLSASVLTTAAQNRDGNRESWQRVADIFTAMDVKPGAVVADVGAGDGFFTTRLARAVGPTGHVYAVDINDSALARLNGRLKSEAITNVTATLGTPSDPKLPSSTLDSALIVNAYHEMTQHQAMLAAIRAALKPGGRLVIVEPISEALREASRERQTGRHEIGPRFVQLDGLEAGFLVRSFEDPFTRHGSNGHTEFLVVLTPDRRTAAPATPGGPAPTSPPPSRAVADEDWQSPALRVSAADVAAAIARGEVVVLDVRDSEMYASGHLPGARLAPPETWRDLAESLRSERRPIITYCS